MTEPATPDEADANFEGHNGRECGEHRTTGGRAWCHDCREWCFPTEPCARCELPALRAELEQARAHVAAVRGLADKWDGEQAEYPPTEPAAYAAAAVRCCAREVRAALSAPVETDTAARPPEIPGCDAVYGAEFWSPLPCRSFHGHEGMHADRYGRTWRDTEAAGTPAAEPAHDDLAEALDYLKGHIATDPRDWAEGRREAVLYALLVGWDCEELHDHADICGVGTAAMDELAARYGWTAEFVATLRRRRRALAGAGAPTEPADDIPAEIISLARAIHEANGDPHMSTFRRVMAALGMSYTVDITRDPDAPVAPAGTPAAEGT